MEGARAGARNGRDCNLIGPARRVVRPRARLESNSNQTRARPARDPRQAGRRAASAALADSLVWYSQAL